MLQCVSSLKAVCSSLLHCMTQNLQRSAVCTAHIPTFVTILLLLLLFFYEEQKKTKDIVCALMCKSYVRFNYRICSPSHCRNASFGIDANTDVLLSSIAFVDVIVLNLVGCVLMIMCLQQLVVGNFIQIHLNPFTKKVFQCSVTLSVVPQQVATSDCFSVCNEQVIE